MTETPSLENSLARFSNAIQKLQASIERRLREEQDVSIIRQELQQMADDRSKMAESLNAATDRSERLAEVNREVSTRLVGAMESIRTVLEGQGG